MARLFTLPRTVPIVSGAVSPGCKANFLLTGTSTPTDTYTDDALTTPHANPVVADAAGVFAVIYLDPKIDYKLTLDDTNDALIYTEDPVIDTLIRPTVTFTSGDATPTVAASSMFITAGTTAITDFDDGKVGDIIQIRCASTNILITDNVAINLEGTVGFNMRTSDTLTLAMFDDQIWHEIGRKYQLPLTKFKTADDVYTSSTLQDDTHLVDYELQPNTFYKLSGYLHVTADAGSRDLEIDINTDNAFADEMYTWITVDAGNALIVDQGETRPPTNAEAIIDIDGTGNVGMMLFGFVLTHATNVSNVDVQFANQAGAGTVTVGRGSWFGFTPQGRV